MNFKNFKLDMTYAVLNGQLDAARTDNERLRKLIKKAEFILIAECPWCGVWDGNKHQDNCPAFGPNGEVK